MSTHISKSYRYFSDDMSWGAAGLLDQDSELECDYGYQLIAIYDANSELLYHQEFDDESFNFSLSYNNCKGFINKKINMPKKCLLKIN